MNGWWQEITGLVLPADCAGCGRQHPSRTALCERCGAALADRVPRRVRPDPSPAGLPPVRAAAPYADEVRAVLLAHKERGALGLARPLGGALAAAVGSVAPGYGPLLLVPVPSSRRSVAARGHDPTRRIAFAAAVSLRRAGRPVRVLPALRHRRAVADQSGLSARERPANLFGALAVPGRAWEPLGAAPVVLVDDLMTTGASLVEAARSVRAAGGKAIGAAVVAASVRGPRPEPGADRSGTDTAHASLQVKGAEQHLNAGTRQ